MKERGFSKLLRHWPGLRFAARSNSVRLFKTHSWCPAVSRVRPVSGWTFAAEVLRAPVPVVVDFRSPPDPPELLVALAAEYENRARVVTVDPAAEPELARCVLTDAGPT